MILPEVTVLRLGHRPTRDARVTTHVCLAARALGASKVVVTTEDKGVERAVRGVVERFGGPFEIQTGVPWRRVVESFPGTKVHLTMYGIPFHKVLDRVRSSREVLVVVGSQKVPSDVYEKVDLNVCVGNQPHSEVSALGIFLYELLGRSVLEREFENARMRVRPSAKGKVVEKGTSLSPPEDVGDSGNR